MNKYHIYVSDNYDAESVTDFFVESDKPMNEVVKAAAYKAICDNDLEEGDVEELRFNAFPDFYGVLIQCRDYHISVWCKEEDTPTDVIEDRFYDIAEDTFDDMRLEKGEPELGTLFDTLYDE